MKCVNDDDDETSLGLCGVTMATESVDCDPGGRAESPCLIVENKYAKRFSQEVKVSRVVVAMGQRFLLLGLLWGQRLWLL